MSVSTAPRPRYAPRHAARYGARHARRFTWREWAAQFTAGGPLGLHRPLPMGAAIHVH